MRENIRNLLREFQPAGWPLDLVSAGFVQEIGLSDEGVTLGIRLPFAGMTWAEELKSALDERIRRVSQLPHVWWDIRIEVASMALAEAPSRGEAPAPVRVPLAGVRNILAVASGKGGVGKSTTAVNLALALQKEGARVGLLDGDIYGPSVPLMLGCADKHPESPDGKQMLPVTAHGLLANSIGFLVPDGDATIWRGPMASKALAQLLYETRWGELDYLIVDLPPGTGDIQLTMAQQVPTTAALIVTTPQDIALADARKGIAMFNKVGVPVLGVVENMSYHLCSRCGHQEDIFGTGGGEKVARQFDIALLGQLPLHIQIRENMDEGKPTVVQASGSKLSGLYRKLARNVAARLYFGGQVMPTRIPTIAG